MILNILLFTIGSMILLFFFVSCIITWANKKEDQYRREAEAEMYFEVNNIEG